MKTRFTLGILLSVAAAVVTVAVKLWTSDHIGIGDFWIGYLGVYDIPFVPEAAGPYVGKAIVGAVCFTASYACLGKAKESARVPVALTVTVLFLVILSLGKLVIA